ncbi:hypothetical protein A9K55_002995 [Cordyceps militaris]|uniref:F-box domain-containing protein n=1 Tax=Cordyceps militaris TaxID=73501 RepID=A0A2H4S8U5_CORMI|nr:hypothetical protein A9K55_002995 [Cordyceps militaris]
MPIPSAEPAPRHPAPSFMVLPAEVRLEIYHHLLRLPPITPDESSAASRVSTAILRTSRLVHAESAAVLYSGNTFVAHPSLLAAFPRLRPWYAPVCAAAVLPRIRRFHLTVRLDRDPAFDRRRAAAAFSGAEVLEVRVVQSVFLGAGRENLRMLEDVRGVQTVTVRGSTTGFEGYVRWLVRLMQSPLGTKAGILTPEEEGVAVETGTGT